MSRISSFKQECYAFNFYAGKEDKYEVPDLRNQAERIREELNECFEGLDNNDPKELLDGIVDVMVTAFGLMQQMENAGFDVLGAMQKIAQNNLTKFPASKEIAEYSAKEYEAKGEPCYVSQRGQRYCVKRISDDKVMKPIGYKSVDISKCVPEKYKGGF